MTLALRCVTVDIISSYCFAQSVGALDAKDFDHGLLRTMRDSSTTLWFLKYFPFIRPLMMTLPSWLERRIPAFQELVALRKQVSAKVDGYILNKQSLDDEEHETIYHHLLAPQPGKSQQPLSKRALVDEGILLLIAGSDTVANTCTVGLFHLLSDGLILAALLAELREAWPDMSIPMGYSSLEKLPYLVIVHFACCLLKLIQKNRLLSSKNHCAWPTGLSPLFHGWWQMTQYSASITSHKG